MSKLAVTTVESISNLTSLILQTSNTNTGAIEIGTNNSIILLGNVFYTGAFTARPVDAFIQANTGRDQANIAFTRGNTAFEHGNAAFIQANTARDTANTRLANTNVTLSGNLTVTGAFIGFGTGFANAQIITTAGLGTFNIPNGVCRLKVTMMGGGGSGGGTNNVAGRVGNGGGSGEFVIKFIDVVPGVATISYNVGFGGTTVSTNTNGVSGTQSNITYNGTQYNANGGGGGERSITSTDGAVGAGGSGSTGDIVVSGFSGANGGLAAATHSITGTGGDSPFGFGQGGTYPGVSGGAKGSDGRGFGAGGSGGKNGTGTTLRAGGNGSNGMITFEW